MPGRGNRYDDYRPDLATLHATLATYAPRRRRRRSGAWRVAAALRRRLVHANLVLDWFNEFSTYWSDVLGNRPLMPADFHYLRGVYRQRQQDFEIVDGASPDEHLAAWQAPELVFQLFSVVYREAVNPWHLWDLMRRIPRGARVLEFGCGIAPATTMLLRGAPGRRSYAIADLPTLAFHYARWRLGALATAIPLTVEPGPLPGRYDAIVCLQVFEHLPSPLATIETFIDALTPGGVLIVDYIRSDGTGLDTAVALRERTACLDRLRDAFVPVAGDLEHQAVLRLK